MLDYLETGLFRGRPDAAPSPRRRSRPAGSPASGVRRVLADGRVLAVAAIVAVALAILAGTSEPLPSAKAGPGRPSVTPSMAPQSPGTSAPPSPVRPSATPPSSAPPPDRPSASPAAAGSKGAAPPPARPAVTTGTTAGASPAASAPPTRRAARMAAGPAVVVTFTVTSRGNGIFEGQIRIVNDGTRPLANWQVSVALPGDRVVAVANASGFVIRGILLLEPASGATPVPPRGGVLNVFFVAAGPRPVSGACTYNQSPCG
jgi:hypothetical protein